LELDKQLKEEDIIWDKEQIEMLCSIH
jgi:hypothetical protein